MYFDPTILYLATVLPPAILGLIVWRSDRFQEPGHLLIASFLIGAAIDIPLYLFINIAEDMIAPLIGLNMYDKESYGVAEDVFQNFFRAAFLEEGIKFALLIFVCTRLIELNEPMDAIVYASAIGLGYAAMENVGYLMARDYSMAWTWTMVKIRYYPLIMHFGFAVVMGLFLSHNLFGDRSLFKRRIMIILALMVPVMFHGVYNYNRTFDTFPLLTLIFIIGIFYYFRREQLERITEEQDKAKINGRDVLYSYMASLSLVIIVVASVILIRN